MKKLFKSLLVLCLAFSFMAVQADSIYEHITTESGLDMYMYDATKQGYTLNRASNVSPTYYVFAGDLDEEGSAALVDELGMMSTVNTWAGKIVVVNPIEEVYGEADLEAFMNYVGTTGPISNVKVIGIDEGATFVYNYLSQKDYFIAGMMLVGGSMDEMLETKDHQCPVYLVNAPQNGVSFFKEANDIGNSLVNTYVTNGESLKEAYANANSKVFLNNYRQHNEFTEFYNSNVLTYTTPYGFYTLPVFESLGVEYKTYVDEKVTGMDGAYSWYEYVPKTVYESKEQSVALVLSLHGNGNDPRIQGDTSGWVELAAKENFIVVSPEWQEKEVNFTKCDGLGEEGLRALISDLEAKYPQIDPSRIYCTGLSAGGAESEIMGAKYSDVFAAIAPVSAPSVYHEKLTAITDQYEGHEMPTVYFAGTHDFFQIIPVDGSSKFGLFIDENTKLWDVDDNTHIWYFIQSYSNVNGLDLPKDWNMNADQYFGVQFDEKEIVKLGDKTMHVGRLFNKDGKVIMELNAIEEQAHWNYQPEAEYAWNFFKHYQRNRATGELIFVEEVTEQPSNPTIPTVGIVANTMYLAGMVSLAGVAIALTKKRF